MARGYGWAGMGIRTIERVVSGWFSNQARHQLVSSQSLAKSAIARVTNTRASAPYAADCWSCVNILA